MRTPIGKPLSCVKLTMYTEVSSVLTALNIPGHPRWDGAWPPWAHAMEGTPPEEALL